MKRAPRPTLLALPATVLLATVLLAAGPAVRAETPIEKVLPADLVEKYNHYRESFMERHLDRGGTIEALLDDETRTKVVRYHGHGDSQGWAGLTMSTFALQDDWEPVRRHLGYWELIEVEPGRYKRWPEIPPDYGHGQTSIDQYGEMLMGMTVVALVGPDKLKKEIARIARDMIAYGKAHGWVMGPGPWADCANLKFLLQLLSDRMELGADVYADGEDYESLRREFLRHFRSALLVRRGSTNYYTLNLFFERLFVAKLLKPDIEGLDDAIRGWYKVVRDDGNTLFDWFYSRVAGKDTSFVVDELRKFPPELPNQWEPTGYHLGYRWQRSPEEQARKMQGKSIEYAGMDFMALAAYYSYFELNDF